jgi:hypothetical protein
MSGSPDGLGVYEADGAVHIVMNHQLAGTDEDPPGVAGRVSLLTLASSELGVTAAEYLLDGTEGFANLASSDLAVLDGKPWYLTGEESVETGRLGDGAGVGRGGSSLALDLERESWVETRHFGLFEHENVMPVEGLSVAMVLSAEDAHDGPSQLYAYMAPTFADAIAGRGELSVFRLDLEEASDPSTDDLRKGATVSGRFVALSQEENADADSLEAAAQDRRAFDFVRLEDAAVVPGREGSVFLAETGDVKGESVKGRLYRLDIDPADPTRAELTLVLDGDDGDDLVNPDSLAATADRILIQEDRNPEHRAEDVAGGYARVLVYDLEDESLTSVARVATPPGEEPGAWESSGIVDASRLLGDDMFLLTVQSHTLRVEQPGIGLEPDSAEGEGGQLLAVRIPTD